MNIIIPMAGMGKRMRPQTLTTAKPLIPVAGKAIVQRLVEDIVATCNEPVGEIAFIIAPNFGEAVEAQLLKTAESLGAKGKICYQETIDIPFLAERCEAAYQYYFKTLDYQVTDLLLKIAEVSNLKKVKTFHDELLELEEIQVKTVLQLKKSMLLIKNLVNGIEFNKKTMSSDEMKFYKINKIGSLSEKFKQIDGFVEKDHTETFSKKTKAKKAKSTEPKKSTIEITLDLWKENLSLIPLLGLVSCLYMMAELSVWNWIYFGCWLLIGLVIYFSYSRHNSKLNFNKE
jgi:hypothetical protein